MAITPDDIRSQGFKKSLNGYNAQAVELFLNEIAGEMEDLEQKLANSKSRIAGLEAQLVNYKTMEKIMQQTLMSAQETSGKSIENARKEAELILNQAQMQASQLIEKARTDLTALKEQIAILLSKKDSIISRLKMLLQSELDTIQSAQQDPEFKLDVPKSSSTESQGRSTEIEDIIKSLG